MSKVSIVIPAYNQARYLAQAIESALQQTHSDIEVVVVDDGSTDETPAVNERYLSNPYFRSVRQTNTGLPGARNRGISESTGDYLCFLDSDDYFLPEKVARQAAMLDASPELGFVYCDITTVDETGQPVTEQFSVANTQRELSGNLFTSLMLGGYFPPHTVMIRRRVLDLVGTFDPDLGGHADYELWLRVSGAGFKAAFIAERLVCYRTHPDSMSKDGLHMAETRLAAFRKLVRLYPDSMSMGLHRLQETNQDLLVANKWLQQQWSQQQIELTHSRDQVAGYELGGGKSSVSSPRGPVRSASVGEVVLPPVDKAAAQQHKQHAAAYLQQNDLAGARRACERALQEDPDDARTVAALGTICYQEGRTDQALRYFERAIQLAPCDAVIHVEHASLLVQLNRIEEAASVASKAVSFEPNQFEALGLLAGIRFHQQQFQEAADLWERISRLCPEDLEPVVARARCAMALGHYVLAELLCGEVLERNSAHEGAKECLLAIQSAKLNPPPSLTNSNPMNINPPSASTIASQPPKKSITIVHKDTEFSPAEIAGGAERALLGIAYAMRELGCRVQVIGKIKGGIQESDGVSFIDIGSDYTPEAILNRLPPDTDVVICVNRADVLLAIHRSGGSPRCVLWLQDSGIPDLCADPRNIADNLDGIVYVSASQKAFYESVGLAGKGAVVHNGFDPKVFHVHTTHIDPLRIVYSGALVSVKGIFELLEAFSLLRTSGVEVELWVYGSAALWAQPNLSDLDQLAARFPFVRLQGLVDQSELCEAYNGALAAIVPSLPSRRLDPFPLTAMEAQACGCPVIVTRSGGLPESIIPGETGFILEGEDPQQWAEQLRGFVAELRRRPAMRENCARHADQHFQWSSLAGEFLDFISHLESSAPQRETLEQLATRQEQLQAMKLQVELSWRQEFARLNPLQVEFLSSDGERLRKHISDPRAPWLQLAIPSCDIPGMITSEERQYYAYITRFYAGLGQAVELGPWLGCSTWNLCRGLLANPAFRRQKLHVFDDFIWRSSWMDGYYKEDDRPTNHGDFRFIYERFLAEYAPHLETRSVRIALCDGNDAVTSLSWSAGPIELCIVDCGRNIEANEAWYGVLQPHFMRGRTLLVLQDWQTHKELPEKWYNQMKLFTDSKGGALELIHELQNGGIATFLYHGHGGSNHYVGSPKSAQPGVLPVPLTIPAGSGIAQATSASSNSELTGTGDSTAKSQSGTTAISEIFKFLSDCFDQCLPNRSLEPRLLTCFHRKVRALPEDMAFPRGHLVSSGVEDAADLPISKALTIAEYWTAKNQLAQAKLLLKRLYPKDERDCRVQDALFRVTWYERHGLPEAVGYELKGRYCASVFEKTEIYPGGIVHFCCPSWLPTSIGNLFQAGTMDEVWNSEAAKNIRRTILDGSYRYCRKISCQVLNGANSEQLKRNLPLGYPTESKEDNGYLRLPPKHFGLAYDKSCNLSCPSCRSRRIVEAGSEAEQVMRVTKDIVFPLLKTAQHVALNGSGECFVSPAFRWLLLRLSEMKNPALVVNLQTNGQLFNEREWSRISGLGRMNLLVRVSIDASEATTYAQLRRGGDFSRLLRNLEAMRELRDKGAIKELRFRFVVQEENLDQLEAFVSMATRYHADEVFFQMLHDWGLSSPEEAARKMVHDPGHPRHQTFIKNLSKVLSDRSGREPGSGIQILHEFEYLTEFASPGVKPELDSVAFVSTGETAPDETKETNVTSTTPNVSLAACASAQ